MAWGARRGLYESLCNCRVHFKYYCYYCIYSVSPTLTKTSVHPQRSQVVVYVLSHMEVSETPGSTHYVSSDPAAVWKRIHTLTIEQAFIFRQVLGFSIPHWLSDLRPS